MSSAARSQQQDNNNNNNSHQDEKAKSAVAKSSVCKPVAINYRSGKSTRRKCDPTKTAPESSAPARGPGPRQVSAGSNAKPADVQPVGRKSPVNSGGGVFLVLDDRPTVRSGPRTVLCYLCGREFGTTSYPLHEPHCLQVSAHRCVA
jgi:hypothetical protein